MIFQTPVISERRVRGLVSCLVFLGSSSRWNSSTLKPCAGSIQSLLGSGATTYKLIVAVWAVLVTIGIVGLALRRFVFTAYSPDPKSYSSGVVALLIFLLMLTYINGALAEPFAGKANWWLHSLIILVFPPLILRSKHFHILMAPVDIWFRTERLGEFLPLDLDVEALEASDEEPSLGLETLADLPWKMRMDFLTCVECRRCTDHCPAASCGQELSPREFILAGRAALDLASETSVIGSILSETALGQCTSCGACEAICPVGIEHLQVLLGAKRAQALARGRGMVAGEFLDHRGARATRSPSRQARARR